MIEIDKTQYKIPEGVDRGYEAMKTRLLALQPALRELMSKAVVLFDDVFPQALHPTSDIESPVYSVSSMNVCPIERIPMGRELTVKLGDRNWVRVFRTSEGAPNSFPRKRLWVWRPENDANRKINVMYTHDPFRRDYPFDIETSDSTQAGMHLGFIGGGSYSGQEPYIAEANIALDDARQIAEDRGLLIPQTAE